MSRQIGVCRGDCNSYTSAPSDEGDSPQCGEMSRSDRGDRRRQRLSSKARLRERKGCGFMRSYFSPSVFLLTQKATSLVRGRLGRLLKLHPYKPRFVFLQPLRFYWGFFALMPRGHRPPYISRKNPTSVVKYFQLFLFYCVIISARRL